MVSGMKPQIVGTFRGKPMYRIAGGSEAATEQVITPTNTGILVGADAPTAVPAGGTRTIEVPVEETEAQKQQRLRDERGRFTTEEVEKIRKEEKEKLYPVIEELKNKVTTIEKEREERLAAEAAARKAAEEEAKKKAEEEMSLKELLQQKEQEWNQRFNQIEQERQAQAALIERERQFAELMNYRQQAMAAAEDDIMPELRDLVTGNSPEEIDASISQLKDRTSRILEQVSGQVTAQRQSMRGTTVTAPPVGPAENDSAYQTFSAEDISTMDMATYAKNRDRLLGAASSRVSNRGLYG